MPCPTCVVPPLGYPNAFTHSLRPYPRPSLGTSQQNSYTAPITVGVHSQLEGTPSFYGAQAVMRGGFVTLDADVGFHYNDDKGKDQVATGTSTTV